MSKLINTVEALSGQEYETEFLMTHPSLMTFGHSTKDMQDDILEKWILSLEDSPVNLSLSLANKKVNMMKEISGRIPLDPFLLYDRNLHCWKMSQISLLTNMSCEYSGTWLKSGMIVNGTLYPLLSVEHHTSENESGSWPTPKAQNANSPGIHGQGGMNLQTAVKLIPTPAASDCQRGINSDLKCLMEGKKHRASGQLIQQSLDKWVLMYPGNEKDCLPNAVGGQLNPAWVEWLMGWPVGWTDLKPVGMDGFHRWLKEFCK